MNTPFRKYSCDCIGIATENDIYVVKPCDLDRDHPSNIAMHKRPNLHEKEWTVLSNNELEHLLSEMAELIADGNGLRNLRHTFMVVGLVK